MDLYFYLFFFGKRPKFALFKVNSWEYSRSLPELLNELLYGNVYDGVDCEFMDICLTRLELVILFPGKGYSLCTWVFGIMYRKFKALEICSLIYIGKELS